MGVKVQDRAIDLARTMSVRDVSARLESEGFGKVSKSTVQRWVEAAKAKPGKGAPSQSSATGPRNAFQGGGRTPPRPDDEDLPEELQGLDTTALDLADLTQVDRTLNGFLRTAKAADDIKGWAALVRLKMDLRLAMAKLRPPPTTDPVVDPLNLAARDAVVAKVRQAVERAEERAKVATC